MVTSMTGTGLELLGAYFCCCVASLLLVELPEDGVVGELNAWGEVFIDRSEACILLALGVRLLVVLGAGAWSAGVLGVVDGLYAQLDQIVLRPAVARINQAVLATERLTPIP